VSNKLVQIDTENVALEKLYHFLPEGMDGKIGKTATYSKSRPVFQPERFYGRSGQMLCSAVRA
jgi:hypothetical protein